MGISCIQFILSSLSWLNERDMNERLRLTSNIIPKFANLFKISKTDNTK